MKLYENLMGKCGFYCGVCPSYIKKQCTGCISAHKEGDCFTRDCVIKQHLDVCEQCVCFPCDTIMKKPHSTVLDPEWLLWKKRNNDG